jgi:hypothetical protein
MVDAERYEFPSMSREYTELAGRGCLSICATAATGDLTAAFAAIFVVSTVVEVCAGSAASSALTSPVSGI